MNHSALHGTLVQLHYHNRPGGVTRVMKDYARSFAPVGSQNKAVVVCHDCGEPFPGASVVDWALLDYHFFQSAKSLRDVTRQIVQMLHREIDILEPPVYIVGHNMTLGKNCAVSFAFSRFAQDHAQNKAMTFVALVHDCPEEGRIRLLKEIKTVKRLSTESWGRGLLPAVENVRIWTPSQRLWRAFRESGTPARLVPNAVGWGVEGDGVSQEGLRSGILRVAGRNGRGGRKKIVFYPVRMVGRKNPLEAVFLASVLWDAVLVFGSDGNSPRDRKITRLIKTVAFRNMLPIVFDPEMSLGSPVVFEDLFTATDLCLSTAVLEGFGFGLYEPLLRGVPLVGRLPVGFEYSDLPDWHLYYNELRVPVAWVSIDRLEKKYKTMTDKLRSLVGAPVPCGGFADLHVRDGRVDFGALDFQSQVRIIERVRHRKGLAGLVSARTKTEELVVSSLFDKAQSARTEVVCAAQKIRKDLGPDQFCHRFRSELVKGEKQPFFAKVPTSGFAQCILKPGYFRFQLDGTL